MPLTRETANPDFARLPGVHDGAPKSKFWLPRFQSTSR
jgi:hypothetical protein